MSGRAKLRSRARAHSRIEMAVLEARVMMSVAHPSIKPPRFPEMDSEPVVTTPTRELAASAFESIAPLLAAPTGKQPLSAIPILHSHPSSTHKVYLDFVGAPAFTWGGYSVPATPAYTQDSDPTTFTQP